MTLVDVTLQEHHRDTIVTLLEKPNGVEASAYILLGSASINSDSWEREGRLRLTSYDVLPVPEEDKISASPKHVTWSTRSFVRLCQRAKEEDLVPGIIHSHPNGFSTFSNQDNQNERELFQLVRNRNGDSSTLASLLLIRGTHFRARLWLGSNEPIDSQAVYSVGRRLVRSDLIERAEDDEILERQALAFGPELNVRLKQLRVGIVGCGGTGSATAMLLARLGVGGIALFDDDIVEASNLNRLHGARRADADSMKPKTEVLAREIANLGLGIRVVPVRCWVEDESARNVLKSCDVIFGCTDDNAGRLFLNRFAYFYLRPVIDMGLLIDKNPAGGFYNMSGRVTVLVPGSPCLLCRKTIDPSLAREESLKRNNSTEYERQRQERYIRGGDNPAPAVVTFTTETACMAVNELLQGITDFRGSGGWEWNRIRRFHNNEDRLQGAKQGELCSICSDQFYWGRGDIDPFLDRTG